MPFWAKAGDDKAVVSAKTPSQVVVLRVLRSAMMRSSCFYVVETRHAAVIAMRNDAMTNSLVRARGDRLDRDQSRVAPGQRARITGSPVMPPTRLIVVAGFDGSSPSMGARTKRQQAQIRRFVTPGTLTVS
ncbi:hypothetical protein C27AD_17513 [Salinisphaera hydrothermalis C27AD]